MEPYRHMNCILRVDTQSSGWEKSLTKVIKRVKDVSYSIDTAHGVIHISGEIDPHKLLTDIKKVGKHAELVHADCGGGQYSHPNYSHPGYEYDGRYTHNHNHTNYPHYESKPAHGYNIQSQYDPQYHPYSNGLLATAPEQRHAPPVAYYDQYDPNSPSYNCNIM